jgi:hypothetical protein
MTSTQDNLAIIHEHYHVTDVGVRMVLDSLTKGITTHWRRHPHQFLWYSPQKFQDQAAPCEKYSEKYVTLIEDNALGYLATPFPSVAYFESAAQSRKKAKLDIIDPMLSHYQKIVHIIQNPTLLKNPVETYANGLIAQTLIEKNYIQIWYIHDLLEESSARQQLRDHIKRIAGDQTERVYGKNGAGLAWRSSPNIFYITINKMAQEAITRYLINELGTYIFYLPNPVDLDALRMPPSFVENGRTLDDQLETFCMQHRQAGYMFDRDADLIIAAEVARERKNTGEQLLILNMLNRTLKSTGKKFQLLITMIPNQGVDKERIIKFQEYIRVNRLPVVMGFGKEIISRGSNRTNGLFTITDLWNHPRACSEISTAVKEGFGLNFINPAVATMDSPHSLTTVGRKVFEVWPDLRAAGMKLPEEAFYDAIKIEAALFPEKLQNICVKTNLIDVTQLPRKYETISYEDPIELGKDFCQYTANEQILLMDMIDYHKLSDELSAFINFILDRKKMTGVARRNAVAITQNLSLASYSQKLEHSLEQAFLFKQERVANGESPTMIYDNTALIDYYHRKENPDKQLQ